MSRILFCNYSLSGRSGTEVFLWDLVRGLQARGWECGIYTPRPGRFSEAFRQADLPVWHTMEDIAMEPDVLHCQHTMESLALSARFPDTPALFMVHDARSWHDSTPGAARWAALVAVDDFCKERIRRETGLPEDRIKVIHNSVDLSRFRPRDPLPPAPLKAAIFTSYADHAGHVLAVRELCARLGIALDELGPGAGKPVEDPEEWLPRYDLVFGKARCALEAMAVGSAVILIGAEGVGEMVTPENFAAFKQRNFGVSLLRPGMSQIFLEEQVRRYAPASARQVQALVRGTCSLDGMVEEFIGLYRRLPAPAGTGEVLPVATVASWLAPMLREHGALWQAQDQAGHGPGAREILALREQLGQQRQRAEHYRAEAGKYKAKAAALKARPAAIRKEAKPLWARLWRRSQPETPLTGAPFPAPFIVGSPRSGTTLLRLMLDAHPLLAIPPETGFLAETGEKSGDPCTVDGIAEWITTHPAGQAPLWTDFQLARGALEDALRAVPCLTVAEGVRCFYRLYAARHHKPRWGDKTPGYALHMDKIRALLPESKFIHLIRDGRDVALSLRGQRFSPGPTMTDQAGLWMRMVQAARHSARYLGGCMEVRYEKLVAHPEPVLRAICDFLELPFDPAMLHHELGAAARLLEHGARVAPSGEVVLTAAGRRDIWENSAKPVDAGMAGQWRHLLTAGEIAEFEETAGPLLTELGYSGPS